MINWSNSSSSRRIGNGNAKSANKSFFLGPINQATTTTSSSAPPPPPPKRTSDIDVNDTTITLVPSSSSAVSLNKSPLDNGGPEYRYYCPDTVREDRSQPNHHHHHLINRNHAQDHDNTKIISCDSNNNNSVIIVTTTTTTSMVMMMTMTTMTPTTTNTTYSSLSTTMNPLAEVAATPSSTPGLPQAAAASQSSNQSQSLLALSAMPKAHVASEGASSALPVTAATTPTPTTTTNADENSLSGEHGEVSSPSQVTSSSPTGAGQSVEEQNNNSRDGSEGEKGIQEGQVSDPNNNSLYSFSGKGGDDNNNICAPATSTCSPPEEEAAAKATSPHPYQSAVPRASPSPAYSVYSSASAPHSVPVSYHHAVSQQSAVHATQAYGMPISASTFYSHPSAALLGHSPQHLMKMMPQQFAGKPLGAMPHYPAHYAAHMAQMSKNMMMGSLSGPATPTPSQATNNQAAVQAAAAAANQQNVAQLAAAYAAQYQQQQAVAASTAQSAVHQLQQRYTMAAQGMNGQQQATAQLFPGYARAPAPPQTMFMQPPHLMRPQLPGQAAPQFYPVNFLYPGYPQTSAAALGPAGLPSPLAAATAGSAGVSPNMHAANYQAIQAVQQAQSASSTGAALGLHPYKKMKTS